jgi:hypothetical protein
MSNFVLVFNGGGMAATEAEQAAVMQAWGVWYEGLGAALIDGGAPFTPVVKHIDSDGSTHDGPVGTIASGYTVIKADSLDAAVHLAKGCPILASGGKISVYEAMQM